MSETRNRALKGANTRRLTDEMARALPPGPGGSRREYTDAVVRGLRLRVGAGDRTYAAVYFLRGVRRRFTLGSVQELRLTTARGRAREILSQAALGKDPQGEKMEQQQQRRTGDPALQTFTDLCQEFLRKTQSKLRPMTWDAWERIVRVEIASSSIGRKRPEEITRGDVRRVVEAIAESGRGYWANRVFETVRRVFSWGVEKDLVGASPCVGLRKPHQERARDRVLTNDEIGKVWRVLDSGRPIDHAVKLLLSTGARRGEVLGMEWREVDLVDRLWRIPAAKTKQGTTHVVPLNDPALAVLEALRATAAPDSQWVFPSPRVEGKAPQITNPQRAAARIRARSGVSFRIHDLRRTVRDNLTKLGVLEHVAEAVIGHVEPSLVRRYSPPDPNRYLPEKRRALDKWGRRLEESVSARRSQDEKIVPIHSGRA